MKTYFVVAVNHNGKPYGVEHRAYSVEDAIKRFRREDTNVIVSVLYIQE